MAHHNNWPVQMPLNQHQHQTFDDATYSVALQAHLRFLDDVANQDIEMQPAPNDAIYIILDTNILLEHIRVLKHLVENIVLARVPITVICPGIVLHELDRQKSHPNLGRQAREATDWMLREVTRKDIPQPVVKGQAQRETCEPSGNWKVRTASEDWSDNDDRITDCGLYFQTKGAVFVYSCDKNFTVRCVAHGLDVISPLSPYQYTSLDVIKYIRDKLPAYGVYLDRMIQNYSQVVPDSRKRDDKMLTDDGKLQIPKATSIHQEVIERFTPLFRTLVQRIGGAELKNLKKDSSSVSRHAPQWQRNLVPVDTWSIAECLEYLQHKKKIVFSNPYPPLDRFLRDPYSGQGALSGVEWTASAWRAAVASLRQIGETWEDSEMLRYVEVLDKYVKLEYQ